jgi:hypothetical protein
MEELEYNVTLELVDIQGSIHMNVTLAAFDIVSVGIAPPHQNKLECFANFYFDFVSG